jgi:cell division protein FtsL
MTHKLGLVALSIAVIAACILFAMKDQVRRLEGDLDELREAVRAEQVALGRLKTEWAMLNQPGRIARLASTYVGLQPAQPSQIVRIDDIPMRADLELAGRSLQVVLPSGQGASLRLKPRPSLLSHPGLGVAVDGPIRLNAESDSE